MITMQTAMIIQNGNDDIQCQAGGSNGKWAGYISLFRDGCFRRYLLSTEPVFETEDAAIEHMLSVVNQVRAADLTSNTIEALA